MKKFISVLFALSMLLTFPGMAYVADSKPDDYGLSAVGTTGRPVLVDEYSTARAQVSVYCSGDTYFAITAIDAGRIELGFTQEGGPAHSLWLTTEDLQSTAATAYPPQSTVMGARFVDAVIEYGKNNAEKSTQIQIYEEYISEPQLETGAPTSDRDLLLAQLEDIYGSAHIGYDWTGKSSVSYQGNTYYFKENLDYYVGTNSLYYHFEAGISFGGLAITLFSKHVQAALSVIAAVLGIPVTIDTIFTCGGKLLRYGAGVQYCRYVLVNGKGPYDECYKSIEYWGWAETGVYYTARLLETGTGYTPTESVFNSYIMQRDRACANYF